MRHFRLGEIAVIRQATGNPSLIGTQCTVTAPLRERLVSGQVLPCYVVELPSGKQLTAHPDCLGKHFERGDWNDIKDIWQPDREREA